METLNTIDGLILGIMIYSGFSHLIAGLRGNSLRYHLYFGLLTIFFTGYTYFNVVGTGATTPEKFFTSCRWEVNLGYLGLIPYGFFIQQYTDTKLSWSGKIILALCIITVVLNNVLNLPILFNAYGSEPYTLNWAGGATYTVQSDTAWRIVADIAVLGLVALSFRAVVLQYKRGGRNDAIVLGIALVVFWFGMLWDNFSEFGNIYTVHVVKYSFVIWMLVMGFKLSSQIVETAIMKKQIEIARNRLVEILNHIPSIVFIKDEEGRYQFINQHTLDKFGMTASDFMGKTDFDIFQDNEAEIFKRDDQLALSNGQIQTFENEMQYRGDKFTFLTQKVALLTDGKKELLGVSMDITKRKNMEVEQIAQKKELEDRNQKLTLANAELDSFVYRVSHDFRAPLASLMSLAYLVRVEESLETTKQYSVLMEQSAKRLDKYVCDILDYSKNSRLELHYEDINFDTILEDVLESMKPIITQKHVKFNISSGVKKKFRTDYFRLRTILNNLVSNAVQYSSIHSENAAVSIRYGFLKNHFVFEIDDNGMGIEKDHQEKIFDMFYRGTAKSEGSGIGLYIVKSCTALLGGIIEVESEVNKGTLFRLKLPQAEQESEPE